jgi:DNA polymerase-3 subunit chi
LAAEVEFHTGIADPAAFACRLLGKAYRTGVRVLVTAPPPVLTAIDQGLWLLEERDFVPHARLPGAAAAVVERSPIWLAPDVQAADRAGRPAVLLNVGAACSGDAATFERVIDVVDAAEVEAGRQRWREYKALGLAPALKSSG